MGVNDGGQIFSLLFIAVLQLLQGVRVLLRGFMQTSETLSERKRKA